MNRDTALNPEVVDAGRDLMKHLNSAEAREAYAAGDRDNSTIVVTTSDETIKSLMRRVRPYPSPVLIAISIEGGEGALLALNVDSESGPDVQDIDPNANMGMILALVREHGHLDFQITAWDRATTAKELVSS